LNILELVHPRARKLVEALGIKVLTIEEFDELAGGLTVRDKSRALEVAGLYNPKWDVVVINPRYSEKGLSRTVLHEVGHWTGHSTRMHRPVVVNHESITGKSPKIPDYDTEEIVAEMIAYQLGSDLDIIDDAWDEKSARFIAERSKGSEHEAYLHVKQAMFFLISIAKDKMA
jgi:hypothetical protein